VIHLTEIKMLCR